jgi:hypothetical protein
MIGAEFCLEQMTYCAERELAAFLHAVSENFGSHKVEEAANLWVQMLEAAGPIGENHHRIFRQITIRAVAGLVSDSDPRLQQWPAGHRETPQVFANDFYGRKQGAVPLAS